MIGLEVRVATALAASLLATGAVQAMEIQQVDKMANRDQSEYIGDLIIGAENVLTNAGRPDLAAQVKHLFTTKMAGDADVIGMVEFERNLALARLEDVKNVAKNPGVQRIEVEDALAFTLEKNAIKLPDNFYTVASGFRPKYPPQH